MFVILTTLQILLIITGLACLRKGGPVILYLLLAMSIVGFVNENLIVIYSRDWWNIRRNVFYNLYSILEIICWLVIYHEIFKERLLKRAVALSGVFILLYSLLEVFIIYSLEEFHTVSYACFSLMCLFFSSLYLFKINNKNYHSLGKDPVFWICAAATCFHAIFLVNLFTLLDPGYWQHGDARLVFHILQSTALIIYYLLICTAFILFFYRYRRITTRVL